jgi:hypothetical protein
VIKPQGSGKGLKLENQELVELQISLNAFQDEIIRKTSRLCIHDAGVVTRTDYSGVKLTFGCLSSGCKLLGFCHAKHQTRQRVRHVLSRSDAVCRVSYEVCLWTKAQPAHTSVIALGGAGGYGRVSLSCPFLEPTSPP